MPTIERSRRSGKRYLNPVPTTVGSLSVFPRILWQYLTSKAERTPRHPLGPFQTDPGIYLTPPSTGLRITWMGHSTALVEIDGERVLIDPVWDQRAGTSWAGPKRFYPAPLALSDLPPLDAVVLSHDHYDHLGAQTVRQLAHSRAVASARWITPLGCGPILSKLGVAPASIDELDWTESVSIESGRPGASNKIKITALPARHFSGRSLFNRFQTLWACFALAGPVHRVLYGADSGEWEGFAAIAREYGPFDLTMLEIGASNKLWADIHMGPVGALRTFQSMGAHGLLMPIHWGLFDLALHAWRQPIECLCDLADRDGVKLWSPEPGLPSEVTAGLALRSAWWQRRPS